MEFTLSLVIVILFCLLVDLPQDYTLSLVMALAPSQTWMVTAGWLSEKEVKVWDSLVGMVVFLLIKLVMTPPAVSIPRYRGVTRRRRSRYHQPIKYQSFNRSLQPFLPFFGQISIQMHDHVLVNNQYLISLMK